MPFSIKLADIPPEGLALDFEVQPGQVDLPPDDGEIHGLLRCNGQVVSPGERSAQFQGTIIGKVARECVRCLMTFEEDLSLSFNADFSQFNPSGNSPIKNGGRRHSNSSEEDSEPDVDMYPIVDGQIDLLPALRNI